MDSSREARVLIRTLPLSNGNYGGILQAYALQRVLIEMGLSPATDLTVSNPRPIADSAAHLALRTLPSWIFTSKLSADLRSHILDTMTSESLIPFIEENIVGVALYRRPGSVDRSVLAKFDKFVAGSDQIWRWAYGDVRSYLFDFVEDTNARIISYAASFGRDNLKGPHKRVIRAVRPLAQRFHSVSVREASGLAICEKYWGISARHHVDPTMLLTTAHYTNLTQSNAIDMSPECLTYILDDSPDNRSLVDRICTELGMTEARLVPKPKSYSEWRQNPDRFLKPSVQTWLKAFSDAEFVVTDSFHGTILAILNNKPFISIANAKRGAGRFDSLLGTFELRHRLISSTADDVESRLEQHIDWRRVNEQLAIKRDEGLTYLKETLLT